MRRYLIIASLVGLGITTSIAAIAKPWGHGGHHRFEKTKIEAFMQLPVEKQTLILSTIKEVQGENEHLRKEIEATKESLLEILTAPTFDSEAYQTNVVKLEALITEGFRAITDAVEEIAPQLTQEERKSLASIVPDGKHFDQEHPGSK